jgi:hypothetical protein
VTLPLAKAFAQVIQVRTGLSALLADCHEPSQAMDSSEDDEQALDNKDVHRTGVRLSTVMHEVSVTVWQTQGLSTCRGSDHLVSVLASSTVLQCLSKTQTPAQQHTLPDILGLLHADGVGVPADPGGSEDNHGAAEHAATLCGALR